MGKRQGRMSKGNSHLPYYGPEYQILLHEGASIAAMQVMKIYFTYMRHDAVTRATHRTILKFYLFSFFLEITIETPVTIEIFALIIIHK